MKKLHFLLIAALAIVLSSCNSPLDKILALLGLNDNSPGIQYIAYKEAEGSKWGLVSPEGKVLVSEAFDYAPTCVVNDRFVVRNSDGYYELYAAGENPERVGKKVYAHITDFKEGVALAAEKGQYVTIIDKDAQVVATLDRLDGKEVDEVRQFSDGVAVFKSDGKYGLIDTKGNVLATAHYCYISDCAEGRLIAVDSKYAEQYANSNYEKLKWDVLDKSGQRVMQLSGAKYQAIGWLGFQDGLLAVGKKDGEDKYSWGLVNKDGEEVVKLSPKYRGIAEVRGKVFTYYNGDKWGAADTEGNTLIRAKYNSLTLETNDRLTALSQHGDDEESWKAKIITLEEQTLGEDEYAGVSGYHTLDNKHALVCISENMWEIVDYDGLSVKGQPDIYATSLNTGDYTVESDFVDISAFVAALKITSNGIDGARFGMTPQEALAHKAQYETYQVSRQAKDYTYSTAVYYSHPISNIYVSCTVNYPSKIAHQNYRQEQVIDYVYGNYYWYHMKSVPTGVSFTNSPMSYFEVSVNHYGKLRGKLSQVYGEVAKKFASLGNVVKQSKGAIVVSIGQYTAYVYMEEEGVTIKYGRLSSASSLDVLKYEDVKENLNTFDGEGEIGC